jgi:hypothetical protein
MSEEQKPGWLGMAGIEMSLLGILVLTAASLGARFLLDKVQLQRMEVSVQRARDLDQALEISAMASGSLPCMRSAGDLPRDVIRAVSEEGLRDGWGNPIQVVGSHRRYVITSVTSGFVDGGRWVSASGGRPSEVIVSNDEVLRLPLHDYDAASSLAPRVTDALAEARKCGDTTGPLAWKPPKLRILGSKYVGNYYVYLPTERDAQGAARDLAAQGFTTEVRRAADSPEWLCVARKLLAASRSLAPEVWRVANAHGGCKGCSR